MRVCEYGHHAVAFAVTDCPVCDVSARLNEKIAEINVRMEALNDEITMLVNKNE